MRLEARLNISKQAIFAMCVIRPVWEQDDRSRFVDIGEKKELDVFNSVSKSSLHWDTVGGFASHLFRYPFPFLADLVIQHSVIPVPYKSPNVCHVRACVLWKKAPIQFCSEHIRAVLGREWHPPQRHLNRTHLRHKIAIMKPGWASPAAARGGGLIICGSQISSGH